MTTKVHNPKAEFLIRACDEIILTSEWPNIVEIGSTRTLEEAPTDGWSTVYLGREAGYLWSVDIDLAVTAIAAELFDKYQIRGWCSTEDGAAFIAKWDEATHGMIDLLYLDSSDDPLDTLTQAKLALPHMAQGSRIVIDDVQPLGANWFGKGTMAIPFLIQEGWKCLIEPTLWQDGNCWAMAKLWKDA